MRAWVLVLLAACGGEDVWEFPDEAPLMPEDPRLGELVISHEWTRHTRSLSARAIPEGWALSMEHGAGYTDDWEAVGIDVELHILAQDGTLTTLPGAEGLVGAGHFLDVEAANELALVFDGAIWHWTGAWNTIPTPDALPGATNGLVRSNGQAVVWSDLAALVNDTGEWVELVPAGAADGFRGVVGWSDAEGVQMVWLTPTHLCTSTFANITHEEGDQTCIETSSGTSYLPTVVLSGVPTDFQVAVEKLGDLELYHFADGAWDLGQTVTGVALAPHMGHSTGMVMQNAPAGEHPTLWPVTSAELGPDGIDDFWQDITCPCTRDDDPTCACETNEFGSVYAPAVDGTGATLFTVRRLTGVLMLQRLDIANGTGDPIHDTACELECTSESARCDLGVFEEQVCEEYDDRLDPADGNRPASIALVVDPVGIDASEINLTVHSATNAVYTVLSGPPNVEVEITTEQPYNVRLTAPGYPQLAFDDVRALSHGETVDLGHFIWTPGEQIAGTPHWDQLSLTGVYPGLDWQYLLVDDNWEGIEARSGVARRTLAWTNAAPSLTDDFRPIFSPDGSLVLLPSVLDATLYEVPANRLVGRIDDAPRRHTTRFTSGHLMVQTDAGATVVYDTTGPTELLRRDVVGSASALSANGGTLVRREATAMVQIDVGTGIATPLGLGVDPGSGAHSRFLPDGRVVVFAPTGASPGEPCTLLSEDCSVHVGAPGGPFTALGTGIRGYHTALDGNADAYVRMGTGGDEVVLREPVAGTETSLSTVYVNARAWGAGNLLAVVDDAGLDLIDVRDGSVPLTHAGSFVDAHRLQDRSLLLVTDCGSSCDAVWVPSDGSAPVLLPDGAEAPPLRGFDRRVLTTQDGELQIESIEPGTGASTGLRTVVRDLPGALWDPLLSTPDAALAPVACYERPAHGVDSRLAGLYCLQ